MNGLKPCPFCGGKGRSVMNDAWIIECSYCWAQTDCFDTEQKAIEAWNRRVSND